MAAFEVIALDTATPQLRAPGASDTYTFPRAVEMPLGTANGVLFLNGSKVVTSGSELTFDGTETVSLNGTANAVLKINAIYGSGASIIDLTASGSTLQNTRIVGGAGSTSNISFVTSGSEQMRLTSTGLGIGTSLPGANLQIGAASSGSQVVAVAYGATSAGTIDFRANGSAFGAAWIQHDAASGAMRVATAGNERMRLDSSGNLGLGVTPSAWGSGRAFEIGSGGNGIWSGSGYTSLLQNTAFTSGAYRYVTSQTAARFDIENNTFKWSTAPSGTAGNAISFTQAMTLDASGNLLVGTTSSGFKLNVTTQSGADRDVFIAGISGGSNGFYVQWNHATAKTHVRIADIPTSSAGLPSGTLWNDGGALKIT